MNIRVIEKTCYDVIVLFCFPGRVYSAGRATGMQ